MGRVYSELDDGLREFIAEQRVFFVASAPLSASGHVNFSPKGLDSLRVLGPRDVAYLDLTGSGIETVAHVQENGRLTLMFCAFQGRPRIVRLQGRGRIVEPEDADWNRLIDFFRRTPVADRSCSSMWRVWTIRTGMESHFFNTSE